MPALAYAETAAVGADVGGLLGMAHARSLCANFSHDSPALGSIPFVRPSVSISLSVIFPETRCIFTNFGRQRFNQVSTNRIPFFGRRDEFLSNHKCIIAISVSTSIWLNLCFHAFNNVSVISNKPSVVLRFNTLSRCLPHIVYDGLRCFAKPEPFAADAFGS